MSGVLEKIHEAVEVMARNRAPKPWVVWLSQEQGDALTTELIEGTICFAPQHLEPAPAGRLRGWAIVEPAGIHPLTIRWGAQRGIGRHGGVSQPLAQVLGTALV